MRHRADCACHDWPIAGDCNCGAALDAANAEIERLRTALQTIINMHPDDVAAAIARAALEGEDE